MFLSIKNTAFVLTACVVCLFAQNRPFPQAANNGFVGTVIKPSNRTQDVLNSDVIAKYDNYKNRYLKSSGNYYYIRAEGEGPGGASALTISEAHGYGMIIFALMAGYDSNAKKIFDGMNALRKAQPAESNSNLMSWIVFNVNQQAKQSSATDGDLDNAYALLLAYKQWGDNAYLNDAKTLINAIKSSEMHVSNYRTNLGDWDRSANNTRSSDWMPGHFRAFREATGDAFWSQAADTVYNLLAQCSNTTTGLIPDFATGIPAKADANAGGTGEENGDKYADNACRDPWRLATDYAHYGTAKAKTQIDKISAWLKGATNSNPGNIKAGYNLNGTAFSRDDGMHFTAPFASGMIANSANQDFLNATYTQIRSETPSADLGEEYGAAIQLLNMLLISGNWWAPYSADPTPPGPTTNYNISVTHNGNGTVKNGNATVNSGTSVSVQNGGSLTLTFTANANYYISDVKINGVSNSAAKTSGTYTFSNVTANQTINVTFTQNGTNPPTPTDAPDLADGSWEWESDIDKENRGSSAEYTVEAGNISFSLKTGTSDDEEEIYTWAEISSSPGGDWTQVTGITITYTSDKPICITLLDNIGLAEDGRGYYYNLIAGTNRTETISITSFKHLEDDWETLTPLSPNQLGIFDGVSISPVNENVMTKGSIKSLKVNGLVVEEEPGPEPGPNAIAQNKTKNVSSVGVSLVNGNINMSLPVSASNANIVLFDVRGRILFERSVAINGNFASVALPKSILRNQAVLLQVKTNSGFNMTKRILIK